MSGTPLPIPVTSEQIARLRLHALGIYRSPASPAPPPAEVVHHHLAMQAQDWGASQWAIGSRSAGSVRSDVLAAYDRGEIVRSWPMRGTVHAVAARDLHWMLELMGQRALAGVHRRWERLGLDERTLERAREIAVERLRGGARATRTELLAAFLSEGIDLRGQSSYHAVWYLAQTGTVVLGPTRDGEQQLVLLDEWVPNPYEYSRDTALAQLAARYLQAHGPATVDDLVHWTKLTKTDCRTAFEAVADETVQLVRDGVTLHMLRDQFEAIDGDDPAPDRAVFALAAFDEHLLGYRQRDDVLDPEHAHKVDPARNGVFRWTIVSGGRVVATWRRIKRARRIDTVVQPFGKLKRRDHVLCESAIAAWGDFVGQPTTTRVESLDGSSS